MGRHVAWLRGHGASHPVPGSTLRPFFIRHSVVTPADVTTSATRVPVVQASEAAPSADPTAKAAAMDLLVALGIDTIPIQHVEEQLNITNPDDRFIYAVDSTEFPVLRDAYQGINMVGIAICEWPNVENFLEDRSAVRQAIISAFGP